MIFTVELTDWALPLRLFYEPDDHALCIHILCFGMVFR